MISSFRGTEPAGKREPTTLNSEGEFGRIEFRIG